MIRIQANQSGRQRARYSNRVGAWLWRPKSLGLGKPLVGDLAGIHSARRGTYRILYRINEEDREVIVVRIDHRSDAYRPG